MLEDRYSLFRKKYIVLRDLYGLDNKIVSQFGNLIYNNHLGRGNIAFWADGRRTPSVDGIFSLVSFPTTVIMVFFMFSSFLQASLLWCPAFFLSPNPDRYEFVPVFFCFIE